MYGSKYYLENLSLEEHSGIIADINFDMLGGNHLSIGTVLKARCRYIWNSLPDMSMSCPTKVQALTAILLCIGRYPL